ncbi:MAG: glycine cleavage system aminomethyltransferase GcvT [Alphaproteobacteria bacterium]|nr:glycine cleavage system aminomethyltransferase GcvT [Alphaproteobacteria bacterium]
MEKQLPLKPLHVSAGARFGPFAGYDMPISYPLGVMQEHLHTRRAAGLFDISHMSHISIEGPGAAALVARACPYAPAEQDIGKGRYTFLLNPAAGMIDDLIVSRLGQQRYVVVANGACADKDFEHLSNLAEGCDASVRQIPRVFLALQGPKAAEQLSRHIPQCASLTFMQVLELPDGTFVSRSGYTGEDGFEIGLAMDRAEEFAMGLLADEAVEWVGLGARDSLRIEAGLPLYGQDMDEHTDPATVGLIWAVPKPLREQGSYVGAPALSDILARGVTHKRVGLKPEGKAPVRAGTLLFDGEDPDANEVGLVTSGGYGPSCGHPVAIGRISKSAAASENRFFADVRGRRLACGLHALPFVPHKYHRGESS